MPYLIIIDKPKGITSFGAVAKVRRALGEKRIGHTGTLDPMATGVLPLLTGRASRLCSLMLESEKAYTATVRLGTVTDTLDITGTVTATNEVLKTDSEIISTVKSFLGFYEQLPPMFSAIKKDGVRLYDLARNGETVERTIRKIEIKSIEFVKRLNNTDFVIDVRCSKGTYIRSLAADIGEKLGTGATLLELRRTYAAGFSITDSVPLDEFIKEPQKYLQSPERCIMHLRKILVSDKQAERFMHGGELDFCRLHGVKDFKCGEKLRINSGDKFLGIGTADCTKEQIKVSAVIAD